MRDRCAKSFGIEKEFAVGARGKKRRRADGSVARSVSSKPEVTPFPLLFTSEPVPAVDPSALLLSLEVENRFAPIDAAAFERVVEALPDGEDMAFRSAESAILAEVGDDGMETGLFWRRNFLKSYLRDHPDRFSIESDGKIVLDQDLLRHAAETPIETDPTAKIAWP